MSDRLTVRQKILVAAELLSGESEVFLPERLIVRAWKLFPESFSLRGYTGQYPDSNRVLAKLAGTEGLRALGWIAQVDAPHLRVTPQGHRLARQLLRLHAESLQAVLHADPSTPPRPRAAPDPTPLAETPPEPPRLATPPRPTRSPTRRKAPLPNPVTTPLAAHEVQEIHRIARSPALQRFTRGIALQVDDARTFWDLRASDGVSARLDAVEALLERAVATFHGATHQPSDSRLPPLTTCYGLLNLHNMMRTRFERELLGPDRGGA